jgi:pimeloyl-ACP methyl ester carboxylesterase
MISALFVHGAGGGGWEWNIWARVFAAAGFSVCTPDLRSTSEGLANTQLIDYCAQVRAHCERLRQQTAGGADKSGDGAIVLIGASLGGLLALMNSDCADALVLVNPMPPWPLNLRLPDRSRYPDLIRWGADASIESTRRSVPDADDAACLYALRRWRDESGAVMNSAKAGVVAGKPNCPVLVVASEFDVDVPYAVSAGLAEALTAQLHTAAGASHTGPLLGADATSIALRVVAWVNQWIRHASSARLNTSSPTVAARQSGRLE